MSASIADRGRPSTDPFAIGVIIRSADVALVTVHHARCIADEHPLDLFSMFESPI